jgi:hypothetical protein
MSQSLNSAQPPGLVRLFEGRFNLKGGWEERGWEGGWGDSREALVYEFWPVEDGGG